ncbi:MAG: hypothetical protein M3Y27_09665, partial [Acidobacteriota bacterium]|nr:hypothetical protein [Acidobacteriota bacterium]
IGFEETFDLTLLRMLYSSIRSLTIQSPVVWKFTVSTVERVRFLSELSAMNIHRASLFPGQDFDQAIRRQLQISIDEMYGELGWEIVPARATGR